MLIELFKKNKPVKLNNLGFMFLEIVIAIALISIVFITLLGVGVLVLNVSGSIQKQTQADFLVKEEFEALRNFRDGTQWATNGLGIVNTGIDNPYHLINDSGTWTLVSGVEVVGIFTKKIIFDNVSRVSPAGDIEAVYNISRDDADTKKVTVIISWQDKTMQIVSYLTNWKNE